MNSGGLTFGLTRSSARLLCSLALSGQPAVSPVARQRPSKEQRAIAKQIGVSLRRGDTIEVAAARLLDAVGPAVLQEPIRSATQKQVDFGASLGLDVSTDSKRVASALITQALIDRNTRRIAELGLKPGDRVVCVTDIDLGGRRFVDEREYAISSIHPHGRIFFKGQLSERVAGPGSKGRDMTQRD